MWQTAPNPYTFLYKCVCTSVPRDTTSILYSFSRGQRTLWNALPNEDLSTVEGVIHVLPQKFLALRAPEIFHIVGSGPSSGGTALVFFGLQVSSRDKKFKKFPRRYSQANK